MTFAMDTTTFYGARELTMHKAMEPASTDRAPTTNSSTLQYREDMRLVTVRYKVYQDLRVVGALRADPRRRESGEEDDWSSVPELEA